MDSVYLTTLERAQLEDSPGMSDLSFLLDSMASELNLTGIVKEDRFLKEYNRLVSWYRDLPEGMFISRLLREYKYSEPDLEESRMMCFDALKAYDDFPFGVQSDLKRRVTTRKGEKLSVKLATDIYKLVSVMEGEDYCDIRELISLSKSRPSQGKTPKKTITGADVSCFMTSGEVLLLTDNVTALQTDVLNMKQMLHAAEKIRSDQMKTFTNSLQVIKCDLLECKQFMSNCLNNFNLSVNDLKLTVQPLESAI
ncbi:hypothetical protein DPMN_089284 [Dreissena polymorpha]|uniref:Uncharacterized protein n=1 Tax=Dreissena polymorpha TaxID=45954 RepID=A0A9D4QYP8_DREPO|nr:hypothetical protein DPMN_089284 [Dreissena polymorpha]